MGLRIQCRASCLKTDYLLTLLGEETKIPMGYLCNLLLLNRKVRRKWKITIVKTQHRNLRTPNCKVKWHSSIQHPLGEILSVAILPPWLTPHQSRAAVLRCPPQQNQVQWWWLGESKVTETTAVLPLIEHKGWHHYISLLLTVAYLLLGMVLKPAEPTGSGNKGDVLVLTMSVFAASTFGLLNDFV